MRWERAAGGGAPPGPGAAGVLHRLLPDRTGEFVFEPIPAQDGLDVFEIETVGGQVALRGPNGVAQASALNWFLKYSCHCHVSWSGDHLDLPKPLPNAEKVRVATPYRYRYYWDYVSFSYVTAFWDWSRWEREIDWMALNGINMPLALTGQEAIWQAVYRTMGLSDREIGEFMVGPAYLPFGWLGCIDGWGGPLPQSWIDAQADLQKKILARERELGMTPVLQGFSGHVPAALATRFPESKLHTTQWSDFPSTSLLDPLDPLFPEIGWAFIQEQTRQFGTDHLYDADTFIEMTPPSNDPAFLSAIARAVHGAMTGADPDAVWLLQGWPFYYQRDFWQPPQVEAVLGAIPDDRMIVLDLWAEQNPVWQRTEAFHGKPWIWCLYHNAGGRPGLYGPLPRIAGDPVAALHSPERGNLCGLGLTMEGTEQNPVVYDLMTEMAWHTRPVDLDRWVEDYAHRRYGAKLPQAERAWKTLQATAYSAEIKSRPPTSVICMRPGLGGAADEYSSSQTPITYDPAQLAEAWRLLLDCGDIAAHVEPYRYDVVDIGQQVMANLALSLYDGMRRAHETKDRDAFGRSSQFFLQAICDLDELLATNRHFLLGTWITRARDWATNEQERKLYEWNARTLITLWGPRHNRLHDYSCRHWSGLLRDFYAPRWEMFARHVETALAAGTPVDQEAFTREVTAWEERWAHRTDDFPSEARGDAVAVARNLFEKYRPLLFSGSG